jgi:hypothetical protein
MATFQIGTAFIPVVGKCYEVHFGSFTLDGKTGFWSARIRVNGIGTAQWIDLDTGKPLDPRIATHVVQGYREIDCP